MYLSETDFEDKLAKIKENNASKERKQLLQAEKDKYKSTKNKRPLSTSKLLLWVVVLICIEIIIFSEYVMIKLNDTSTLYTLIGVPVTLIPTVLGYYFKSAKENTAGGIVYESFLNEFGVKNDDIEELEQFDNVETEITETEEINNDEAVG